MRAIQESIDLTRIADVPSFPREIQWFASISIAIKSAVIEVWKSEADVQVAARLSNLIVRMIPRPQDWKDRWEPAPPPDWVEAVDRAVFSSLSIPIELSNEQLAQAYNEWLEKDVLDSMRTLSPERYQSIVEYIRSFILSAKESVDEDEKEKAAANKARKARRKSQQKRDFKQAAPKTGRKAKARSA